MTCSISQRSIETFIIPPYRPQYQFNLAKSINEVIYCREHSLDRINTLDIICFAESKQRLKDYRYINEPAFKMLIQRAGKYFSLSPHQKKTELPLMILTDTQTIFVRRLKRLKKLQKKQISQQNSDSNSQADIIFSHSSIIESTSSYLKSKLSKKSFSDLISQETSAISMGSCADIYNLSYSLNEKDVRLNLKAIEQTIKESTLMLKMLMKLDEQEKQFIDNLKKTEQQQLSHLIICNYEQEKYQMSVNSKQKQQPQIILRKKSSDKSKSLKQLKIDYEPNIQEQDLVTKRLPEQIKQKVGKQLKKYKLNVNSYSISSSSQNRSKKKVREKAQQMLKSMGVFF